MAKSRKQKHDVKATGKASPKTFKKSPTQELKPISVWAQQIKDKLVKSQSEPESLVVPESITTTLPSPLVAIVQENTVAKMARVLKEKMLAFSTDDTLVTPYVDSSEVTLTSPVPPLCPVLIKPLLEDIAPLPVLTVKEKFGYTYQRSYPSPKKRNRDHSEDSEEESTAGISRWLDKEESESFNEQKESMKNKTENCSKPTLQDRNSKKTDKKKIKMERSSTLKNELPKSSLRAKANVVKKSTEKPKKSSKKTTPKKKEIVVKRKLKKKQKKK